MCAGQESIDAARASDSARNAASGAADSSFPVARSNAGKSDGFRISGHRGDIHVEAATVPTLLFGVNWYLRYVALMDVSTNGSQLGRASAVLPAVNPTITRPLFIAFAMLSTKTRMGTPRRTGTSIVGSMRSTSWRSPASTRSSSSEATILRSMKRSATSAIRIAKSASGSPHLLTRTGSGWATCVASSSQSHSTS